MNRVFFLSGPEWKKVRQQRTFEYVVIGRGSCALGFVDAVLRRHDG